MSTSLINRNIKVGTRRSSLRLEASMWEGLQDIARREQLSVHDICTMIDERLAQWEERQPQRLGEPKRTLAGAVRVFISAYYRRASTEDGHASAGHGRGHPLVGTPFEHADPPHVTASGQK